MTDRAVIKRILRNVRHSWEKEMYWQHGTHQYSNAWLECIGDSVLIEEETAGLYADEMENTPHYILPRNMCQGLKDKFEDAITIMGMMDGVSASTGIRKIKLTSKQEFLLNKVEEFLTEIGYKVSYPITICSFTEKNVLGLAFNDTIYLSDKVFDMGRREIAATIIEENEHIITGFEDKSRSFQNHFINKYLTEMEERNSNFL